MLKNLVFGIYKRNETVIIFPVSDRKHETLIQLIKQDIQNLYYSDAISLYCIVEYDWKI